ncbi:BLUF domain-containing protein [Paucibacter sp. APW11]|uniref:BLUF domain-containing protein n=1 Tax=Roseateles aquae TaxID=3077235 RepID=A0ABU3PDT9_9BURK|nr:BLUF domain-containing protein [Paucibacter sp. APW11]MDT9000786.1 BLUF domain-containing protein [Paucibacter sp. APW11]
MPAPIFQLIYASEARAGLGHEDLLRLLVQSRRANAECGLSGILLHCRGQFLQVLEGDRATIEALLERIEADERHQNLRVALAHVVAQRDFEQWTMALYDIEPAALAQDSALAAFFQPDFDISALRYGSPSSFLLRAFRELSLLEVQTG